MLKCECGFQCKMRHNMHIHRESKNHERNMKLVTNQVESNVNNGTFSCHLCDYSTNVKANYRKHIISAKHLNKIKDDMPQEPVRLIEVMDMFLKHQTDMSEKHLQLHASTLYNQQIQNTEMFKALTDRILAHPVQPPIMLEQTITNNNHTTTNNSKQFNLNLFLNEECKNAMNMSDFIRNVIITAEDLENIGELGYTEGMSKILTKAIRSTETTERPMHCTDVKRETIYVRKDDVWKKDEDCEETKRLIQHISHKNYKALAEWREQHPEHAEQDTVDYESWYSISRNMCNTDPLALKKLIRHLALTTSVEKNQIVLSKTDTV